MCTKEDMYKLDAVDVYKLVLKDYGIRRFPNGFWHQPEAKQNAAKCTKYLLETMLRLDDEMIKDEASKKLFVKYKLGGMVKICFQNSPYKAIDNAYPNKFREWEFGNTPNGYWNDIENAVKAVKWLIEDKLKLDDEQLKEQCTSKIFTENRLGGMLQECFNGSPYRAINKAYPNKFKEWEFRQSPINFWESEKNVIKATKWLVEKKLKLNNKELKKQLSCKLFEDNGLGGMLQVCFNGSPYKAINKAYPNKFKEWEFSCVPNSFWCDKTNKIKAIRWLIEEKLKLSEEELKKELSYKLFLDNGLNTMINDYFDGSPYEAINYAYPNKYKPWEFKKVSRSFWKNKENGIKATKWLIEEKLKLNDELLKVNLSANLFRKNGLGGMLQVCFNNSPYEAINSAYPGKFKKEDF